MPEDPPAHHRFHGNSAGGPMTVSVPYSERRHRIHGDEIEPVKRAVYSDLLRRLRERDDLLASCTLFRFWIRIETHCRNKPKYPPHDSWEQIETHLGFGGRNGKLPNRKKTAVPLRR